MKALIIFAICIGFSGLSHAQSVERISCGKQVLNLTKSYPKGTHYRGVRIEHVEGNMWNLQYHLIVNHGCCDVQKVIFTKKMTKTEENNGTLIFESANADENSHLEFDLNSKKCSINLPENGVRFHSHGLDFYPQ